jgi:hypothetical protein
MGYRNMTNSRGGKTWTVEQKMNCWTVLKAPELRGWGNSRGSSVRCPCLWIVTPWPGIKPFYRPCVYNKLPYKFSLRQLKWFVISRHRTKNKAFLPRVVYDFASSSGAFVILLLSVRDHIPQPLFVTKQHRIILYRAINGDLHYIFVVSERF